jgi:lipid A ethanolaminephosphotransferase
MSEGFQQSRGLSNVAILRDETFPHDFPFYIVMGAFGLRSDIYKPQFDFFNIRKGGF